LDAILILAIALNLLPMLHNSSFRIDSPQHIRSQIFPQNLRLSKDPVNLLSSEKQMRNTKEKKSIIVYGIIIITE
jgi:hypothetical protein